MHACGHDGHTAILLAVARILAERRADLADAQFQAATVPSTLSETYYNYATFLAAQGRKEEAREWAKKILAKKPTMPGYLRRRERPWFRNLRGDGRAV